jgi:hypothetical protein
MEAGAELIEVGLHVVGEPEVDEGQAAGCAAFELVDRAIPGLEVELRGWGGRGDEVVRLDPHSGRVAGIERAVSGEVGDVVTGVSRGGECGQAERLVADCVDVRFGDRGQLSPQVVERGAVEASRAALEPGRVDQVRRADLGDVDLQISMLTDEDAGGARVVEVDVAQEQVTDVGECEPEPV